MKKITDIDEGTIRRIDWQTLVPPTILFRAFSATFKPTFLFLGAILAAILATWVGFRPFEGAVELNGASLTADRSGGILTVSLPYITLFQIPYAEYGALKLWQAALIGVVAAWFALAFSRSTVVRLTSSARSSTIASSVFALRKFRSLILPGLLPLGALFALWFCAAIASKLGTAGQVGAPLFLLAFLLFGALFLITALAFPLAITAVATENSDCFDATSRGISYVTQRFLFFLIYSFFSLILIRVGFGVVELFTKGCLRFYELAYANSVQSSWIAFWRLTLVLLPTVYACCSFVVYMNAIYIMLRRSVDGTPYDSCVLDLKGRKPRELRQILQDSKGAPVVAGTEDAEESRQPENNEQKDA